jgi:hypothetical protein
MQEIVWLPLAHGAMRPNQDLSLWLAALLFAGWLASALIRSGVPRWCRSLARPRGRRAR